MKKFTAIFLAILLIGCNKSDGTKETPNNSIKQSSKTSEVVEKNLSSDSEQNETSNTDDHTESEKNLTDIFNLAQ
mgnify:CR=1 FL=1